MVRFLRFLLYWHLLLCGWPALSQSPNEAPTKPNQFAKWQMIDKKLHLTISLETQLSEKQKNLINSGFSSYSEMSLLWPRSGLTLSKTFYKSKCTVKYDTWEERYELARIDQKFKAESLKAFDDYSALCLTANISDPKIIEKLTKKGGIIHGHLTINQISNNKSEEIKEWLIKQQSGVMQGLFSHMLGDLKLSERETILIHIPSLEESENRPIKVNQLYPKKLGSNEF